MKSKLSIGIIAALLCIVPRGGAVADFITGVSESVTQDMGGLYHYTYTLTNDAASDLNAIAFRVSVGDSADLQAPTGPDGWVINYTPGDTLIDWESSDSPFDLAPGASAVFGFASLIGPIDQDYGVLGFDGSQFGSNSGTTLGPGVQSVPEPSSLALLGVGAVALPWLVRRPKRSRRG